MMRCVPECSESLSRSLIKRCSRLDSPAMMRRTNRGSRSSSSNTISLGMYSNSESHSVCAVTTCGRSMNMTASPKLCPGPIRSTTFSSPRGDVKASFTWPKTIM